MTMQSRYEGVSDCPECGQGFETTRGMKQHHTKSHGESLPRTVFERECASCGTVIERYRSQIQGADRWFCSQECLRDWQKSQRPDILCDHCGDEVNRAPSDSRGNEHNFCGMECYRSWQACDVIGLECEYCGGAYERKESDVYDGMHFCSPECRAKGVGEDHRRKYRNGEMHPPKSNPIEVEETGHIVDGGMEKWVDLTLHGMGLEYEHEQWFPRGDDRSYFPDFVVEDLVVIEVKGRVYDTGVERAEDFMAEHRGYVYVVVGEPLPCDIHIPWEEKQRLPEEVGELIR